MVDRGRRAGLTRDKVVAEAVAIADVEGITAVSMRRLGRAVGVEAMSLYNHVSDKGDLLDGMIDAVFAEIDLPVGADWREAMRRRAHSAREVLNRHRWAVGLMESRTTPGPETLRHHDAVLGALRAEGFPVALAAHAFSAIDSYLYGFVLQETSLPFDDGEQAAELVQQMLGEHAARYPHLAELSAEHVRQEGYEFGSEFGYGLDLILDALAHRLAATCPVEQAAIAGPDRRAGTPAPERP
ncbi:TetR/AcrR family transcriptional regulator C-terminal domain-containing protein [Pseudonocardia sp.]|uniref:TetR/AcrR family transcriptional regulator C-terminal domain-containing protein n=1 Tax=Pseudonocardia sp. TaxID=60912 RepID=UPI003D126802